MRVLHVFKDYYPPTRGGIEQLIHEIVHSMEGIKFGVLTSSRSKTQVAEDDAGVRVVRSGEIARVVSTPITPSWRKVFKESGADLLHFHMPNPFGELQFVTSRSSTPMVASYHADIVGRAALVPFFKPFQHLFLSRARTIIVSNPRMVETSEALKRHRAKCTVIPYGIVPERWASEPTKTAAIRERLGAPLIVFMGRLVYYKGVEVLIEAMKSVEARCLIIGEGPLRHELEAAARTAGASDRINFLGEIDDDQRSAYLHAADLFVLPSTSRAEAFGISMLQAMACGTPAISTELGTGTSWVNVDNRTGIVVPPKDPAALAGAIKAMLRDTLKTKEMGLAAQERVNQEFTLSKMLASIREVYTSAG